MSRRVVVTGVGALSALGDSAQALWEGLLAGRSGIRPLERPLPPGLKVTAGGEVPGLPHDLPQRDEILAQRAISAALAQAGLKAKDTGFIWSTGLASTQSTRTGLKIRSPGDCFQALSGGHSWPRRSVASACASGTQALGEAFRLLRRGKLEACVAGGSSTILAPVFLTGFHALGALAPDKEGVEPAESCRPFDRRRRGFALAEGAGALVVESAESARRRGAVVLGEVIGFGVSQDAFDLNRPPPTGGGAELCMRRALTDAGLNPADIDAINAHGTGTLVGDPAEAAALRRVMGESCTTTPVSSVKGALGHTITAAGALEAIVAIFTCRTGIVPPTVNLEQPDPQCELDHVIGQGRDVDARRVLSASFAMGGQNAAVVLQRSAS